MRVGRVAPAKITSWAETRFAARPNVARRSEHHRRLCRLILIEVYSGTRQGAIYQLRWVPSPTQGWIDLENGVIHRAGTAQSGTETKKHKTLVHIHARLLPHLRRWREADMAKGVSHVIHHRGRPIGSITA